MNKTQFERNSLSDNQVGNWGEIPNVAGVDYTQFSKGLLPQIKVHTIINNAYTKEVTVAFNPNSTDSYDLAMEATSNEDLSSDVYLSINGYAKPFCGLRFLRCGIQKTTQREPVFIHLTTLFWYVVCRFGFRLVY